MRRKVGKWIICVWSWRLNQRYRHFCNMIFCVCYDLFFSLSLSILSKLTVSKPIQSFLFKSFSNANNARMFFFLVSSTMPYLPNKSRTTPSIKKLRWNTFRFIFIQLYRFHLLSLSKRNILFFNFFSLKPKNHMSVLNFPFVGMFHVRKYIEIEKIGFAAFSSWEQLWRIFEIHQNPLSRTQTMTYNLAFSARDLSNLEKWIFYKLRKMKQKSHR